MCFLLKKSWLFHFQPMLVEIFRRVKHPRYPPVFFLPQPTDGTPDTDTPTSRGRVLRCPWVCCASKLKPPRCPTWHRRCDDRGWSPVVAVGGWPGARGRFFWFKEPGLFGGLWTFWRNCKLYMVYMVYSIVYVCYIHTKYYTIYTIYITINILNYPGKRPQTVFKKLFMKLMKISDHIKLRGS